MSRGRYDGNQSIDETPAGLNFREVRGDSFSHLIEVIDVTTDEGGVEVESPRNLSDKTIRAQIRPMPGSTEVAPFTVVPDDLSLGRFYLRMASVDMTGPWDLEVADPVSGEVETLLWGFFQVERDVTR